MNTVSSKAADNALCQKDLHAVHIDQRNKTLITGVKDICCYDENEIILKLHETRLVLNGSNLHLGKLLLDEGRVDVEGQIDSIVYETPYKRVKRPFLWKRKEV